MPLALSVAGDRLAVASGNTGKIHIFDIADPRKPAAVRTLGRGDGPFGKWLPIGSTFKRIRKIGAPRM